MGDYNKRCKNVEHMIHGCRDREEYCHIPKKTLAQMHDELVHPDGSECPDGCDAGPVYPKADEEEY